MTIDFQNVLTNDHLHLNNLTEMHFSLNLPFNDLKADIRKCDCYIWKKTYSKPFGFTLFYNLIAFDIMW